MGGGLLTIRNGKHRYGKKKLQNEPCGAVLDGWMDGWVDG
jgi:hypothetical protein